MARMRVPVLVTAVAVVLAQLGCRPHTAAPREPAPPPPPVSAALIDGYTDFAFRLFAKLRKEEPEANVFVSPTGIAVALAMTCNGAAGDTEKAMLQTLGCRGMPIDTLNKESEALLAGLRNPDPQVELSVANSIWTAHGTPFRPTFIEALKTSYDAPATELDFAAPAAPRTIDDWVKEATRGRIDQIVDAPINPLMTCFLIDAVYFNGKWTDPFEERDTKPADFRLSDGSTKRVKFMSRDEADYSYLDGDGFRAIVLPYGNGRVSMFIFLPDKGMALEGLCARLNPKTWKDWLGRFDNATVNLKLPKFRLEYDSRLKDTLSAVGMGIAFDPNRADFSRMSPEPQWIYEVKHKTFVEVTEEGTEAAAATEGEMAAGEEAIGSRIVTFVVDRPFLCAIRDHATGAILFLGAVADPEPL
ncbi:MAG: serpin family protein [Armatimonadetes bacterium]|nr:serpin family protein [Armatimonadota bacterium]